MFLFVICNILLWEIKKMNNYTVDFTKPEASVNSTLLNLEMYVLAINFLVGLPTHSYVIWLIVTGTGSGISSEFFFLNVSVCELGSCLNSLFVVLNMWTSSLLVIKCFFGGTCYDRSSSASMSDLC